MDIIGKETLEKILQDYTGTLLFVSHDRYFVKQVASSVLVLKAAVSAISKRLRILP